MASGPSACWDVGSFRPPFWVAAVAVGGLVPIHAVWLLCWHDLPKFSWRFFASFRSFLWAWGRGGLPFVRHAAAQEFFGQSLAAVIRGVMSSAMNAFPARSFPGAVGWR